MTVQSWQEKRAPPVLNEGQLLYKKVRVRRKKILRKISKKNKNTYSWSLTYNHLFSNQSYNYTEKVMEVQSSYLQLSEHPYHHMIKISELVFVPVAVSQDYIVRLSQLASVKQSQCGKLDSLNI
uniref:Uncharacterized protein n=1 Tax=Micrurus corallinus TaxID=54390 RepID=A0A2D4EXB0_MICCO